MSFTKNVGSTTCTVNVTPVSGQTYWYRIVCRTGGLDDSGTIVYDTEDVIGGYIKATSNFSRTISGLVSGQTYTVNVLYYTEDDYTTYAGQMGGQAFTTTVPTPSGPPVIQGVTKTDTTIRLGWSGVYNADIYRVRYRLSGSSSWTTMAWTSSTSTTISGLSPLTSYQVAVQAGNHSAGTTSSWSTARTITTNKPPRPSDWAWSSTVQKDSGIPTTKSGGVWICTPLTAEEWNNFVDRIAAFEYYVSQTTSDYSACKVTKGARMLASTAMAVRAKIAALNPPTQVPDAIASGYNITADWINGLMWSLNSIP